MIPVLLIVIPLVTGLISFFLKEERSAKAFALLSSVATLAVSLISLFQSGDSLSTDASWLPMLGSRFSVSLDGMGKILTLLTAVSFPIIFAATYNNKYKSPNAFYGFMLLTQAGLMGVFCAMDLFLFYFFWELALIPAYFLCSKWGGEKRIPVTFKFFVYTFLGSLLMLVGILFVYFKTPDHSFAISSLYNLALTYGEESFIFWLFFIAFAIKMPVFPFHTWQPDTYEQAPTAVTMVLSGIMVKMGVFAVIRWLLPMFPGASERMADIVMILAVTGMIYASLIAIRQDDMKRLVAYSSIAHIGLMAASMFTGSASGIQGVIFQMFAHGINIIGLWIVIDVIEQQLGTRKFSELGGLAQKAPVLAIMFVIMSFANIALPLTNSFVGEFLMFNSVFNYSIVLGAVACISIILAAVYTLWMVQKVFYGEVANEDRVVLNVPINTQLMLAVLVAVVLFFGIYPQPMINLTSETVTKIIAQIK
ncbi:NADH-quinone oxidoreductase subunit M [Segetibacter sp.]|uniref:complex I subunit 4 family protein n=1 Tax=Segetibacter sp. TaxID=2231182 RepID=UPI002610D90F|nr:NADH-quinone oxidoreductase subunit M [Segetibacter sp.]MCW3078742.1 NADH-quinone oxidoreductase subunit [Segetibacter sp.]